MKKIVIDLDNTITLGNTNDYENVLPNMPVIEQIRACKTLGYEIVIHTARNMRTYQGEVGKINKHTLPIILQWLEKNDIPFDEVIVGKPWCGHEGFYVDDRAIRPTEFAKLSEESIQALLKKEKEEIAELCS